MKIAINGFYGRMGQRIHACGKECVEAEMIGGIDQGERINPVMDQALMVSSDFNELKGKCDCMIDFSSPKALEGLLTFAVEEQIALVIGTTGYSEDEKKKIEKAAKKIPILFSPNMSLGVNFLFHIVPQFVQALEGWDIELLELHHNKKKDAPSGTAKGLLEAVEGAMKVTPEYVTGRDGNIGARKPNEVGCFAIRGGDVVGEHTLYFMTEGERIELTHKASSRDTFARGSVRAALYLENKAPGLYTTLDMIREKLK